MQKVKSAAPRSVQMREQREWSSNRHRCWKRGFRECSYGVIRRACLVGSPPHRALSEARVSWLGLRAKVRSTKSGKKFSGQKLGVNRRIHSNPGYRRAQLDETHRKNTLLLPSANYSLFSPFSPLQGRYFLYREGMKISPVVHLAPTGAHS